MNETLFTGKAEAYTASRPSYSPEMIRFLYTDCGFSSQSVIADIGAGTGKFSQLLLEQGSFVYAVEPNEDMRKQAQIQLAGFERKMLVNGSGEHTTLLEPVDFITCAQAFHWLEREAFRRECRRILKPEGQVLLIWNIRDSKDPLNQGCEQIFRRYCSSFHGFSRGIFTDDLAIRSFFTSSFQYLEFDYDLTYCEAAFIQRCLSSSYSLCKEDPGYFSYIQELKALFASFQTDGAVHVGNKTVLYMGSV